MPLGGRGFHDMDAFLDAVDVVTVASPATFHAEQALAALAAGKPVYIEKPIAISVADAEQVRAAAAAKGLVVACGHQERVVFQAMGLLDIPEQPLRLEAAAPWPAVGPQPRRLGGARPDDPRHRPGAGDLAPPSR